MKSWVAALTAAVLASSSFAQESQTASTNFAEAKITVNERARADGCMRVRVIPQNGAPREATLPIARRMSENDLAKSLADALEPVVAPLYEVDRDAGEHVKIKKAQRSAPNFSVEIAFSAPGSILSLMFSYSNNC